MLPKSKLGKLPDGVSAMAQAARIPFQPASVLSDAPAEEIVDAARRYQCDLIFMGSHSRSGVSRLLGSINK